MITEHDKYCVRHVIDLLDSNKDAAVITRLHALIRKRRSNDVVVEGGRIGSRQPEFMTRYADVEPPATRQTIRAARTGEQDRPRQRTGGGMRPPDYIRDGTGTVPETCAPTWQGLGFDGPPVTIPE